MNTVSSLASTPAAPSPTTRTETRGSGSANEVSVTASPEPQISPKARALAEFYEAASAFVQKEHLKPFTGWKYDSAGYVLNRESGYLDVERYNNYLFDKAATTLVDQAKQMGLALDKDETLAQLKADNAGIAAIRYSAADRIKYQNMCADVVFSNLTYNDINSLTDMYIAAKENGLDATQVGTVAFRLGDQRYWQNSGVVLVEPHPGTTPEEIAANDAKYLGSIQNKLALADEIKAKLANTSFGFDDEKAFFEGLLAPFIHLGGIDDSTLDFLSQILDIYSRKQ
ncbi:MAG: hypothetical protein LBS49_02970 [Candidatus Accumulibacter sp.]|jgi:hypothetical protein|nr:hypothetical protein [Accumulibacter sp.]